MGLLPPKSWLLSCPLYCRYIASRPDVTTYLRTRWYWIVYRTYLGTWVVDLWQILMCFEYNKFKITKSICVQFSFRKLITSKLKSVNFESNYKIHFFRWKVIIIRPLKTKCKISTISPSSVANFIVKRYWKHFPMKRANNRMFHYLGLSKK
jgi:hypothetical protein